MTYIGVSFQTGFHVYFILSLVYINLATFQLILLVKCLQPFHSKPEEGAKENMFHSYGDMSLVDSCALPLAVCLENCTPLLPGCILSIKVSRLNKETIWETTHFVYMLVFLTG